MTEDVLNKISRSVDVSETAFFVKQHFGLSGTLKYVSGERDHNFIFTTSVGVKYIVKVAHEDESVSFLELQSNVIARIASVAPHLPVSYEVKNKVGQAITSITYSNGDQRFLRLNNFMPGQLLYTVPLTQHTRRSVGALTANLAGALAGFTQPAAQRNLLWDIQQAPRLSPRFSCLPSEQRELVNFFYAEYMQSIAPNLDQFRKQIIHNDLNLHNIFVSSSDNSEITGCIDFGDMVHAPVVNDLAVAAAYQLDSAGDVVQSIIDMAEAYHAVYPLLPLEIDHLCTLVAMRCALTVTITYWRAGIHPENAPYILRNAPTALAGLKALSQVPAIECRQRLHHALRSTTPRKPSP